MIIGGTNFGIQPWPEIKTTPGLGKWKKLANGYYSVRDFGAARDIYESKVLITDVPSVIHSLQNVLQANRNAITLSGFNDAEIIFGADVDYSEPITATVTDFGKRKNLFNNALDDLEIEFRVISKTLLATAPSLAGLKLQQGWTGDRSTDVTKHFSYDQSASYLDNKTDAGFFKGSFVQTTEQMKAIRAYLLTVARAEAIPFPTMGGSLFYPFGANEADSRFQKCNIMGWSDQCFKVGWWNLEINFAQAYPYFPGGSGAADIETDHLAGGTSGEADLHGVPLEG